MSIYVAWQSYLKNIPNRGYWDQALLRDTLEKSGMEFTQVDSIRDVPSAAGGVIFILPARSHVHEMFVDRINDDLGRFKWVLIILTSDEDSMFFVNRLRHPNMRLWLMTPHPTKHGGIKFFGMPIGYPTGMSAYVDKFRNTEKSFDWSFVGNDAHLRRCLFVESATSVPNGRLILTNVGSGSANRDQYYEQMASSKVIPCPSGAYTPDSFRVYEALELGCVPVADNLSPNEHYPPGYWKFVFGDDIPFPIIDDWSLFPDVLGKVLAQWDSISKNTESWWKNFKNKVVLQIEKDIRELSQ